MPESDAQAAPEDTARDTIPAALTGVVAAVLAVSLVALSLQIFDDHIDRCIAQVSVLLALAVVLAEGALRDGRLFMPPSRARTVFLGFAAAISLSFFLSDIDKYHLSQATLLRLLWPVTAWLAFVAVSRGRKSQAIFLQVAVWIAFGLFFWKSVTTDREIWRLAGAAAGAGLMVLIVRFGKKPALAVPAAAALFLGAWAFTTQARLSLPEVDLIRNNWHLEKSVAQVARAAWREARVMGTGPGSIDRKYLEHRPIDATLYRLPDWLERPPQTLAVMAGETGILGITAFVALLMVPLFCPPRRPLPAVDLVPWALYGFLFFHESLGGGWLLRTAPPFLFFALAGLLLAGKSDPPVPVQLPGSAFFTGLVAIGGILLLQQLFFWKTHEIEKRVREINTYLDSGLIDRAVQVGNYALQLDNRRNDILSAMIGAMYRARAFDRALDNSLALLARDPLYPSVKNNIAAFYLARNEPGSALPYMRDMTELHPTVENFARLGHIQSSVGKTDEARSTFRRALELFPREMSVFMAGDVDRSDSIPDGRHILQSANYAAEFLNNTLNQSESPQSDGRVLQNYTAQSRRFKEVLGLGGG